MMDILQLEPLTAACLAVTFAYSRFSELVAFIEGLFKPSIPLIRLRLSPVVKGSLKLTK